MGCNSNINGRDDHYTAHNITNDTTFKFHFTTAQALYRASKITGLYGKDYTATISCSGTCNINNGDKITYLGQIFKVKEFTLLPTSNQKLNFINKRETVIYLE